MHLSRTANRLRSTLSLRASLAATPIRLQATSSSSAAARQTNSSRFPGPLTHNQHTQHMVAGVGQLTPVIAEKASGSWIYGRDGKKYLDFCCGIGVTNLGHCHPKVPTYHTGRQQNTGMEGGRNSKCVM